MRWIILGIIASYIIGSIPWAYIFVKLLKGVDIRELGSGNVGATNASRVIGKPAGTLVFFLDVFKGFFAVVLLGDFIFNKTLPQTFISEDGLRIALGLVCVSGHNWSIFLNFKGGKGVATTVGVLSGLSLKVPGLAPVLGLLVLTWSLVFIFFRIISLASVSAAVSFPVYLALFRKSFRQPGILVTLGLIFSLLIILRHKANLKRLLQGKEPRFK